MGGYLSSSSTETDNIDVHVLLKRIRALEARIDDRIPSTKIVPTKPRSPPPLKPDWHGELMMKIQHRRTKIDPINN